MTDYPSLPETEASNRIVYVRSVKTIDLPQAIQAQAPGVDHLYAIHAPNGEVLALLSNRDQAFMVARQNEYSPVSAH